MAELSNLEWFVKKYCEPVVVHDTGTKDGDPDNDQKQPEAESQVKHLTEI